MSEVSRASHCSCVFAQNEKGCTILAMHTTLVFCSSRCFPQIHSGLWVPLAWDLESERESSCDMPPVSAMLLGSWTHVKLSVMMLLFSGVCV